MLNDVVVDANVLGHAANPEAKEFARCVAFLRCLEGKTTVVRVDPGFHLEEAKDRSYMGLEYRNHMGTFGSVAFHVVSRLAASERIKEAPDWVEKAINKRINQLLRNRKDRTYLCVAINTADRTLVSHDYTDFQAGKRQTIEKDLAVSVVDAVECHQLL